MTLPRSADPLPHRTLRVLVLAPPGPLEPALRDFLAGKSVHRPRSDELGEALQESLSSHWDAVLLHPVLSDAEIRLVVEALRAHDPDLLVLLLKDGRGPQPAWSLAALPEHGALTSAGVEEAVRVHAIREQGRRDAALARGLLDALDAPTCAVDASASVVVVNAAWLEFGDANGAASPSGFVGESYLASCEGIEPGDDAEDGLLVAEGLRSVLGGEVTRFQHEYPCHGPDDQRWFTVRITPAEVRSSVGAVISHVDVTAMHLAQQELAHQAVHDALTGLPTRALLEDRLAQALADAGRSGRSVGVGFLDLDGFKAINDTYGHSAGDALLRQVAQRLRAQLRGGDTVARQSGDEFVLVWRELVSAADVRVLTDRVHAALAEPFPIAGALVSVSASLGVSVGSPPQTAAQLLVAADSSMYDAKRSGSARARPAGRDHAHRRLAAESSLDRALARDELVLHYQPVVDLATGRPVGLEALMRWRHPLHGLLPPGEFIPHAEASGMVVALGRWALLRACEDLVGMVGQAAGLEVAVNVSALQLVQPSLVGHVREALALSGLDPARLVLEVTESAIVTDEDAAGLALEELSHLGVRLAVDDFGTGYSSLLYLRRYPFSTLKLDRAFVSGLGRSSDDEAISRAVISLAHAVGATAVAEGVETPEQLAALHGYGCELGQGFLWSPAVPLEDLPDALDGCRTVARPAPVAATPRPTGAGAADGPMSRILAMHEAGASLHTIAAALNREQSRTASGARWSATAVARRMAG